MSRTRIVKGKITEIVGEDLQYFSKSDIVESAAENYAEQSGTRILHGGNPVGATSIGNLDLIRIAITTKYDVCHDEVGDFSDYKNFWILEDNGKYYHWLT